MIMKQYFDEISAGIETKLRAGSDENTARKLLTLEIARLGARLFSPDERVAWCGVLVPFDLLQAMGVTSCFVEFVGAVLASTDAAGRMLEMAEQDGYGTDGCGYHRAVTGATLEGLMPEPDFLIASSAPCSGGLAVLENLARHFKKDLFVVHIPQAPGRDGAAYLADQFRAMADFVADHTGRPLDPAVLRAVMERTNRTRSAVLEIYDLARSVPSPARRRDMVNFGIVMPLLLGTDAGLRIAEAYRDEFARKVRGKVAGVEGERVRLMWLQNRIQFRNPLERLLEEDHRAAVVIDELNDVTWDPLDPDDPYMALAERALSLPLTGPVERRIRNLQRLARSYQVDGAINPCHWGCRQGTGARGMIEKGLKEVGVPVLNLEVDCVDARNFAPGQLKTRVDAFIETIVGRRASSRAAC